MTIRELLDHVKRHTQLDVIAITDHDRIDAALWAFERQDKYPFDIVPGVEVSSTAGHILGLWITKPVPPRLNLEETVAAIHEQGGLAVLAHPFHFHLKIVAKNLWRYVRHPEILNAAGLDGIEVHNAGVPIPGENALARWLGHLVEFAFIGGSDAHTLGAVGCGVTRFIGHTAADLRTAIVTNRTAAQGRAWPLIESWKYLRYSRDNTSRDFTAEPVPYATMGEQQVNEYQPQ